MYILSSRARQNFGLATGTVMMLSTVEEEPKRYRGRRARARNPHPDRVRIVVRMLRLSETTLQRCPTEQLGITACAAQSNSVV